MKLEAKERSLLDSVHKTITHERAVAAQLNEEVDPVPLEQERKLASSMSESRLKYNLSNRTPTRAIHDIHVYSGSAVPLSKGSDQDISTSALVASKGKTLSQSRSNRTFTKFKVDPSRL